MASPMIILGLLGAGGLLLASFGKGTKTAQAATPQRKSSADMPLTLRQQIAGALKELGVNELGQIEGTPTSDAVGKATALASLLEQEGYPEAAKALRGYAETAAKLIKAKKQQPLPGIPAALQTQIDRVLAMERDPARLRAVAGALRSLPNANDPQVKSQADMLDAMAAQIEAQQKQSQVLTQIQDTITATTPKDFTAPQFTPGTAQPAAPVTPTEVIPMTVTAPTPKTPVEKAAEALAMHLKRIQASSSSVKASRNKMDAALVKRFQALANTSTDGKPGPGTTALMAKHGVCDLPLVMYWPSGSTKSRVIKYREALYALADNRSEPCASELRTSASRERGQGGIVGPMPA